MTQPSSSFYERVLSKYGLATALAVFFVYWITSDVSGTTRAIKTALDNHISETAYYLRAICINTSTDDAQRASCMLPRVEH